MRICIALRRLIADQEAAEMAEYALLLALILVAVTTAVLFFGGAVSNAFNAAHSTLVATQQ